MKSKYTIHLAVVLVFFVCSLQSVNAQSSLFIKPQFPVKITNDHTWRRQIQ